MLIISYFFRLILSQVINYCMSGFFFANGNYIQAYIDSFLLSSRTIIFLLCMCVSLFSHFLFLSVVNLSPINNKNQWKKASILDNRFSIGQSATIARSLSLFPIYFFSFRLSKERKKETIYIYVNNTNSQVKQR
jgi:hypothetical protein